MSDNAPTKSLFLLGDRAYDLLKRLVQVILPATSALYFGLASIWDLPSPDKVVGTIAVITTFLGVCLGISSAQYASSDIGYDGKLVVTQPNPDGPKIFSLEIDGDVQAIPQKKSLVFKIKNELSLVDENSL